MVTPLKFNIFAPENGGTGRLYTFLLGPKVTFQGRAVKLREGMVLASLQDCFFSENWPWMFVGIGPW